MFLTSLMPYLMPDGTEGGGAAGGEGNDGGTGQQGGTTEGQLQDQQGGDQSGTSRAGTESQPSANKLIKDFAAARGITVEALLSSYEELENAGKTELQKATGDRDRYKADAERLTAELRDARSESAFVEAARAANARGPKTLFRAYKDQLAFDKSGNPTNIAEVIDKAKADEPDLFKPATGNSDAGRRGDGDAGDTLNMNQALRELANTAPR